MVSPSKLARLRSALGCGRTDTCKYARFFCSAPILSREQLDAAQIALHGEGNVFITGSAGTGNIINELYAKYSRQAVAVTAATGVASILIQGKTLHAFACLGFGVPKGKSMEQFVDNICSGFQARLAWRYIKCLIIDEISMIDSDVLTLLDHIARRMKNNENKAFGGIKVIMCGDFFQLPPVELGHMSWPKFDGDSVPKERTKRFAFDCETWNDADIRELHLTEPHRQHEDPLFAGILRELRQGRLSNAAEAVLQACHVDIKLRSAEDAIEPTRLYCKNVDVDKENESRLAALPGVTLAITAVDKWVKTPLDESKRSTLKTETSSWTQNRVAKSLMEKMVPTILKLKVGAQVFTK